MTGDSTPTKTGDETATALVRLSLVLPFFEYLESRHISTSKPLALLGLSSDKIANPEIFVHAEVMYGLTNELANAARDPFLGVHVGETMDLASWPPFVASVSSAKVLGEFLALFLQAVPRHSTTVTHSMVVSSETTEYRIERMTASKNPPKHSDGIGCAMYVRLLQAVLGDTCPPEQIDVYTAFPEAIPPAYGGMNVHHRPGQTLAIAFPTSLLFSPVQFKSSISVPDQSKSDPSLVSAIQAVAVPLLATSDGIQASVAQALGIGPEAMEKALAKQGTSFAKEIRVIKNDTVTKALAETGLSIAQIGASIGYLDAGNFTRYFKAQFGMTPIRYRQNNCQDQQKLSDQDDGTTD